MLEHIDYRRAGPADALCLSVLATQVFLDTYATNGINTDLAKEAITVYSRDVFAERLTDQQVEITLAEANDHLVGFVDLRRSSQCPVPAFQGPEVFKLYVQRPFQRNGIGQELMALAEESAMSMGARAIWLTAWAGNAKALAFYPCVGYQDVGVTQYVIEGTAYENRVFAKQLQTNEA